MISESDIRLGDLIAKHVIDAARRFLKFPTSDNDFPYCETLSCLAGEDVSAKEGPEGIERSGRKRVIQNVMALGHGSNRRKGGRGGMGEFSRKCLFGLLSLPILCGC